MGGSLAVAKIVLAVESAQLGEQVCRAMRRLAEVREVEALVLPVGVARRILESEQQRGHAAEHLDERTDERDRAAAADQDRVAAVARAQRAARGVERGPGGGGLPARHR